METIILAGGLGTRLKDVIHGLPKPMAPIKSKPFLAYLLDYLVTHDVTKTVLSVGYKYKEIISHFGNSYRSCHLVYSIETDPLGTGGAIQFAMGKTEAEDIVIVNGDTLFRVPLQEMMSFHLEQCSDLTIALKPMINFDRYGSVLLNDKQIVGFEEKKYQTQGMINGGTYIIRRSLMEGFDLPLNFSFETDFLEKMIGLIRIVGFVSNSYFIDIGIPQDYERAQLEFVDFSVNS